MQTKAVRHTYNSARRGQLRLLSGEAEKALILYFRQTDSVVSSFNLLRTFVSIHTEISLDDAINVIKIIKKWDSGSSYLNVMHVCYRPFL